MLRFYLGLTRHEWRIFKERNLNVCAYLLQNHAALKAKYLQKWWYLRWFLRKFKHKHIVRFEKLKLLFTRKVSVPTMDFNITTRCTLKCQDCGSLMPLYAKNQHFDENLDSFKLRLDALLKHISHIYQFKIIGGEPLLNKDVAGMVDYACSKGQILLVEIVTNGTIIPTNEMLETLKRNKHKIQVYVSNYTLHNKTKYDEVLNLLAKNDIPHNTVRNASDFKWVQRGEIFARNRDSKGIKETFWNCWQKHCVSYFEGRYLVCTRAYYIEKALNHTINLNEGINLNTATNGGGGGDLKMASHLTMESHKICRVNLSHFTLEMLLACVIIAIATIATQSTLMLGFKLNKLKERV